MPKKYAKNVKKGKLKMALFFLVVTCFIWFLSKFSKDFTATVEATIEYINLPNNMVLKENNINNISFDFTSSGFDFLSYKFKKPVIPVNVSNYFNNGLLVTISNNDLNKIITSELKSNITVKNLSVNEINLKLDTIISKEIPINIVSEITYKNGYKAINEIKTDPIVIVVSGPSSVIDSVKNILTKPIRYELLSNTVSGEIELEEQKGLKVDFSKEKVYYTIVVEEFTQKVLSIPIVIKNLPLNTSIQLIPEVVDITFDISITKFNSVSDKDFIIICDYNNRNMEGNFLIPELIKKPTQAQNVLLQNNKIEYLIFK